MNINFKLKPEMDLRSLQKKDWVLIALIVCVSVLAVFLHEFIGGKGAGCATVKVRGEIEGVYSLAEDQTIEINGGTNLLQIKNGTVDMLEADCPDKLCVNQKAISKNGESIICLPNKVVVTIESDENSEFDAVAQ